MSTDNWYLNRTWNESIAFHFEEKLRRARQKEQYLRIQASMLTDSRPDVAHALLDRYFELPYDFDHAQAYDDRASAFIAEGKFEQAVLAYEAALQREAEFPKLLTQAYVDLPYFVALRAMVAHYPRAVEVLESHRERLMFPVDHFKWHAALAIIAHEVGKLAEAAEHAKGALVASAKDTSGFRNHPRVGLVICSYSEVETILRGFCDA